jgi:hypothetical protein
MSRISGVSATRRMFRRLPDVFQEELRVELRDAGGELLADEKARAPARTGKLRAALQLVTAPKTLRIRVGLVGKAANRKFFYGRILHWGRKAALKRVSKRGRNVVAFSTDRRGRPYYLKHVGAIPPNKFVIRPRPELWGRLNARIRAAWDSVLRRAAGG